MAEAKNRKTRRTLSAVRRKFADKLELESVDNPVISFDGDDEQTYTFPTPCSRTTNGPRPSTPRRPPRARPRPSSGRTSTRASGSATPTATPT
ncbi:hypothetical protein KGD82_16310 [Nocardiopsis eucommiae]|uniref:Uncharacterized protein n=1 Tax=Nocardiopsis eucommiae TaxID=2831970 RepID=A0A975L701_9ACTN|nr:hypothetical protein KGD82_16310 [Nocardiopsis eucommiae]